MIANALSNEENDATGFADDKETVMGEIVFGLRRPERDNRVLTLLTRHMWSAW